MSRFFVPAVLVSVISGLAFGLIVVVVARSPETHGNVRPDGFDRTPISFVGEPIQFAGGGLAAPMPAADADPAVRGRLLFLAHGCATCHGLAGQGGVVGPRLSLEEMWLEDFEPVVRSGPGGMPAFAAEILNREDLETIYAFLKAMRQGASSPSGGAEAP